MRRPWTRTTVRIEGHPGPRPPRRAHATPSRHDRLLVELAGEQPGWAVRALTSILDDIGNDRCLEPIAAVDAWLEDANTFCLVYAPPDPDVALVGIRCRRGDVDPNAPLYGKFEPAERTELANADDPDEYADDCITNISEPLGNIRRVLRYDSSGIGWWGTLGDTLPAGPGAP